MCSSGAVPGQLADLQATLTAGRMDLNLRGILRGKMALVDAGPGLSPLASASVFPGQWSYLG